MMSESEELHKNHLGEEKSQYLLQHKDNPVHWFSFGPKAFELAKKEKKPILISIGYSTCHWCHVMERESFEDHQVADLLNKYFVSIKVDREELPDVDAIYMRAALSMMHGGGGWPLNVFVTPDLKPFFAGTYFPKETFTRLVAKLGETWQKAPSNLQSVADQIHQHLSSAEVFGSVSSRNLLNESLFCRFFEDSEGDFDEEYGGFGRAPKFPPSMRLQMLMRIARRSKDPATSAKAMHMVEHTLKSMVKGGLWDHLGGGFARYSTDRKWLIPHFEKMLYDNALLLYTYIEAFQMTRDSCFEAVSKELINYILTVMQHPEGGFYSAEDADSEGEEGKFYVWKKKEIDSLLLPEEAHAFCEYYGVTEKGNFEGGTNHLHLLSHPQLDWGEKKSELIAQASMKLKAVRDRRIHPLKDTKILTSWNGLMIRSMAMAAHVFADTSYAEAASKAASFIKDKLYSPSSKTLFRRYRDGEARFSGTLDDYAYLISGLLELYQTTFNTKWLQWAQELQETQDRLFGDEEKGGYFYSPAETEHPLIIRTKDFQDGAQPNSNSISALNLLMLENLTFNKKAGTNAGEASSAAMEYKEKAVRVLSSIGDILQKAPEAFTQALIALDFLTDEPLQLAIVIPKAHEEEEVRANMVKCINEMFIPNKVVAVGSGEEHIGLLEGKAPQEGQVTAYVCQGTACLAPTTKPEKLRELLVQRGKGKTYSNL